MPTEVLLSVNILCSPSTSSLWNLSLPVKRYRPDALCPNFPQGVQRGYFPLLRICRPGFYTHSWENMSCLVSLVLHVGSQVYHPQLGSTTSLHPHAITTELVTISEAQPECTPHLPRFQEHMEFSGIIWECFHACICPVTRLFGHSFSMYLGDTCVVHGNRGFMSTASAYLCPPTEAPPH